MRRLLEPELLDALPGSDSRAMEAREDLLRLNRWMGHVRLMEHALRDASAGRPGELVELGGGDGRFLLEVARRLPQWRGVKVKLIDRQESVAPATLDGFARLGWRIEVVQGEALDWLRQNDREPCGIVIANLFLHHFDDESLRELLQRSARLTRGFVALEPRRSGWSLACSRLVGLIGCGAVTRADAPVSVRAGFTGRELTAYWSAASGWVLTERPAGLFSHLFIARRENGPGDKSPAATAEGE